MTPSAQCVAADASVLDATKKLTELGVGTLPICGSDDRLTDMLTDRDIAVKVLVAVQDPASTTAGKLARGEAVTIGAEDDVAER